MGVTSALVLFAVIWWMVFFVVLPLRLVTQDEDGDVVRGTPRSAPVTPNLRRKVRTTTVAAAVIWAVVVAVILSGAVTVRDFDVMNRLPPVAED